MEYRYYSFKFCQNDRTINYAYHHKEDIMILFINVNIINNYYIYIIKYIIHSSIIYCKLNLIKK